jgi:general secretion pathway protein D
MALEISTVTGSENIGGITQPVIGQRRIEHETRLEDGDVNLLGGILEDSETQSLSGYPWISRVPILKYLFAQDNRQRRETEIIFAITPHIVRAQELTDDNLRTIDVGTGAATELRHTTATPPANERPAPGPERQESPRTPPLPARPGPRGGGAAGGGKL